MRRLILLLFALFGLGCEASSPNETTATNVVTDLSSFRGAVLDSLEIHIDLLKNGDTIYSHHENSNLMTRNTFSDKLPWYEGFDLSTATKHWTISVQFDSSSNTLSLYSGIDRVEFGEYNEVRGLQLEYDEATKVGVAELVDQKGMWGRYLYHKWSFYKVRPGEREHRSEYAGFVDSTTVLRAWARMHFR
jgi:hypothetical protein